MTLEHEESSIHQILEFGLLIGSRKWGFSTDESDYDVVVSEAILARFAFKSNKRMRSKKDSFGEDRTSWVLNNKTSLVYQLDSGEVINFIVYSDETYFELWRTMNKMFETITFDRNNKNKIHRFVETTFSSLESFLEIGNPFVETDNDLPW